MFHLWGATGRDLRHETPSALTALLAVPLLDEPLTLFVMAGVALVTIGAFVGARR